MAQIIYEHDSMNSLSGPTPHSHDTKERGPLFICTHNAIRSPMAGKLVMGHDTARRLMTLVSRMFYGTDYI